MQDLRDELPRRVLRISESLLACWYNPVKVDGATSSRYFQDFSHFVNIALLFP